MNDEQRAALVEELAEAIHVDAARRRVFTAETAAESCLPIIDRLLATRTAPTVDELMVELTDDMLPGLAVGIARNCGKWDVQQVYDGLDESWPTSIHGEGDSLNEALRNAVAQATTQEGASDA